MGQSLTERTAVRLGNLQLEVLRLEGLLDDAMEQNRQLAEMLPSDEGKPAASQPKPVPLPSR